MPELPEVETIVRGLAPLITGQQIQEVEIHKAKVIACPEPSAFAELVKGRTIERLQRRGKYILMELSGGVTMVIHLRMTGQLVYYADPAPPPKHTHLVLRLAQGWLRFTDPRQFGRVLAVPASELDRVGGLKDLGPEPLDPRFTEKELCRLVNGRKQKIKALLLDQRVLAGMGNIYTDEALYLAGIHPDRPAAELTARETKALYSAVKKVLDEGIAFGGTSVRDYVDAHGVEGRFQKMLKVYGKKGEPCPCCGTPIARTVCAGRGTYFCPRCQNKKCEVRGQW
ncbi:bifunctional DNA-formamidopyrimidine glycosylase/DNA-(apurinic or apyrimidinic site) lyase [Desulforudis sp. 1088]|uniref:bifunctional DNA-formamidopyrimidine glycosylase/DNA-(apurinic or apyrimidinic site) lyase n=1 Tax=unclassified Candidatus Desulforudis TaxID=2635950 RepID=UPI003CE505AA